MAARKSNKTQEPKDVRARWAASELSYIERQYDHQTNEHIARKLGRSARSVCAMAHRMGLKKTSEHRSKVGRSNIRGRWGN